MDLSDERGILVSWIVKLALGMAIVGLVLFELGAIAVNTFTLSSSANDIAIAVSTSVQQPGSPNETQLQNEARELAKEAGAKLVSIEVDTADRIVHVTLRRRAKTLIIQRFAAIAGWGRATAEGQSGYQ